MDIAILIIPQVAQSAVAAEAGLVAAAEMAPVEAQASSIQKKMINILDNHFSLNQNVPKKQ